MPDSTSWAGAPQVHPRRATQSRNSVSRRGLPRRRDHQDVAQHSDGKASLPIAVPPVPAPERAQDSRARPRLRPMAGSAHRHVAPAREVPVSNSLHRSWRPRAPQRAASPRAC